MSGFLRGFWPSAIQTLALATLLLSLPSHPLVQAFSSSSSSRSTGIIQATISPTRQVPVTSRQYTSTSGTHRRQRLWFRNKSQLPMTTRIDDLPQVQTPTTEDSSAKITTMKAEEEAVPTTYAQAIQVFFFSQYGTGPFLVSIALLVMLCSRILLLGPLASSDVAVFLGSVAFWSVQEHFLHAQVLHSTFDWYGKAIHQAHHDKPYFSITVDPPELMLTWMTTAGIIMGCLFPLPTAISATLGYAMAGLWYEWAHFIVHTKVRPKSTFMKRVRDNHMRHHQIDSRYWFAFSLPQVDTLFGTNPDVKQVVQQKRAKAAKTKKEIQVATTTKQVQVETTLYQ